MQILITGGAGYIGSHTCLELLNLGHEVIVMDNLSNSKYESLKRVQELTGKKLTFYETDLNDSEGVEKIFITHTIEAVIHFAGLKAVGESVALPLKYYENNVTGTVNLCKIMEKNGVKISSSVLQQQSMAIPTKYQFWKISPFLPPIPMAVPSS